MPDSIQAGASPVGISHDAKLNTYLRQQMEARGVPHEAAFDWLQQLRRRVKDGGFSSLDEETTVADIFYVLVCSPGSLWGYLEEKGTSIEQRWMTLIDSRVKDHRRNRGRRLHRLGEVQFSQLDQEEKSFDPEAKEDPVDHDRRIEGFVEFLRGRRNGPELVGLLESRLAGEPLEEYQGARGWSQAHLSHLDQDLRYYLGLYSQRFRGLQEELAGLLQPFKRKKPEKALPIRCFCEKTDLIEVRVVYHSRSRALTKVEFPSGDRCWIDPRDLLEPVASEKKKFP